MDPRANNWKPTYGGASGGGGGTLVNPYASSSEEYYEYGTEAGVMAAGEASAYDYSAVASGYPTQQQRGIGYETEAPTSSMEPGSFYPVEGFQPEQINGAPVSAIAYDDAYKAIFVASASKLFSRGGASVSSGGGTSNVGRWMNHRASTLVTHSTTTGMLYSCVAGHPEASPKVLNAVYGSIFVKGYSCGTETTNISYSPALGRRSIPNHAYRPFYATVDPVLPDSNSNTWQMGINTLLPCGEGHVVSVSPAGVRLHTHGGFQTADLELEGMIAGTMHRTSTHVTVGGLSLGENTSSHGTKPQVSCLDIWQDLRPVMHYTVQDSGSIEKVAVTALASSSSSRGGNVVAGCNDGYTRILDDRLRQIAKVKSHPGGVTNVAVSEDGTLIATTGYGSKCSGDSGLYSFPDMIKVYDIRYLGRGGIAHSFAGLGGGPRHLAFLPPLDGMDVSANISSAPRLLVASGQGGGGMQILVPFQAEDVNVANTSNFILPQLDRSESITALHMNEDMLGLGTSKGKVLQYRMAGYQSSLSSSLSAEAGVFVPSNMRAAATATGENPVEKRELEIPPFEPPVPALSLEPGLLLSDAPSIRVGMNDRIKSISTAYTLAAEPQVSSTGDPRHMGTTTFGPLSVQPRVAGSKYQVSSDLMSKVTHAVDFLRTIPTSNLSLDLFEDHRGPSRSGQRKKDEKRTVPLPNPNKLLYSDKLFEVAYEDNINRFKGSGRKNRRTADDEIGEEDLLVDIPSRYRLTMRPTHKLASTFSHAEYNHTGCIPGWDYPSTMPNAFVPPVLLLLSLIPEVRNVLLEAQFRDRLGASSALTIKQIATKRISHVPLTGNSREQTLAPELGFLFHRIDALSRTAYTCTSKGLIQTQTHQCGAWAPTNFISCLATLPEADQLQILDGSPAAVDTPRRAEAFYRFLLYQIDKELSANSDQALKVMDSICGVDFSSVNDFITSSSGPPSTSTTRAMTVEMYYGDFVKKSGTNDEPTPCPYFGEVLQKTLCRESRLRAWNQRSDSYETIVQRKIATSLPTILSLSCACAGRNDEEGLFAWRRNPEDGRHWLPEVVEVELAPNGNVIVRELVGKRTSGDEDWKEFRGKDHIPKSIAEVIASSQKDSSPRTRRYGLEAVVSMVRDDLDRNVQEASSVDGSTSHHVLHSRLSKSYKKRMLSQQKNELELLLSSETQVSLTLVCGKRDEEVLRKRLAHVVERLQSLERQQDEDEWVLTNGYIVENTVQEDARAFHVKFKEPLLVVFRAADSPISEDDAVSTQLNVPTDVIRSQSITNGTRSPYAQNQRGTALPGKGDLVAFDAEFVSVQEEVSTLTETGSKVTVQEVRHAMGRISVVDCKTMAVIFDDHVLPREHVVDYLTRFSGIVERDLDPKLSPHHLISTRTAYLKLRCLVERGCVFVGHGLSQDFWTANIAVPANQVIDTVEIYHKPAQRYVSLRFLTNFVLGRDMQKDVHDSLEDATAAFELYKKALQLKKDGEFDDVLEKLYEYGRKVDWKLGIEDS